LRPIIIKYICATAITITALVMGHDGTLAFFGIAALLGVDIYAKKRQGKSR